MHFTQTMITIHKRAVMALSKQSRLDHTWSRYLLVTRFFFFNNSTKTFLFSQNSWRFLCGGIRQGLRMSHHC